MLGVQLLASGAKYEKREVDLLPAEFRKEIGVRAIQDKGILHKDKEVQLLKAEREEAKHARRTGVPLTIDLFKEKAKLTAVGNDLTWKSPEIVLRTADLERLASSPFWKGLRVMDKFTNVLKGVLPYLWDELVLKDEVTLETSKTGFIRKIIPYLKLVDNIAEKRALNTLLPDVDMADMKRTDILASFVKQDDTTHLSDARAATKKIHKLTAALISSGGTEIDERYGKKVLVSAHDDNDLSEGLMNYLANHYDDDEDWVELERLNDLNDTVWVESLIKSLAIICLYLALSGKAANRPNGTNTWLPTTCVAVLRPA
jgi:hypothetical protein